MADGTSLAGIVAGLVLFPVLGRVLPDSLSTRMAVLTIGANCWGAGMRLMAAESPVSWNRIVQAWHLVDRNIETLSACRSQARATGEAQACTLAVSTPGG